MSDIFVSYSKSDKKRVAPLVNQLESQGWSVFWDPALLPGRQWDQTLSAELDAARCVVVAWSKASLSSQWVREEASKGRDKQILVPVSLDGTQPPLGFGLIQAENLSNWRGDKDSPAIKRLLAGIGSVLDPNQSPTRITLSVADPAETAIKSSRLAFMGAAIAALIGIGALSWSQLWPAPTIAPATVAQPAQSIGSLNDAIASLNELMKPALGRVRVGIKGGNQVALGNEIAIEADADISGRLIILDINAAQEVTQIFPNKYVISSQANGLKPGVKVTILGPGYGFTAFKAVEPVGQGRLLALLVPGSSKIGMLREDQQRLSKGFQPIDSPARLIQELKTGIASELPVDAKADLSLKDWGFELTNYQIVK